MTRRALVSLLLVCCCGFAGVAGAEDDYFATFEGTPLAFTVDELTANDGGASPFEPPELSRPAHGTVACAEGACTYVPDEGFTGEDSFTYSFAGAQGAAGEVRIQVSPVVVPLAGDWDGDGLTDLGWYHGRHEDVFFAELEPGNPDPSLPPGSITCSPIALAPGARGWIAFAGDWDGDGRSEIGFFDPRSRTSHLYERDPGGPGWVAGRSVLHPGRNPGGLPVAGDWDGDGDQEPGVFVEAEHRFELLESTDVGAPVNAFALTDLRDDVLWLPVAGDWGDSVRHDLVGVWSPDLLRFRVARANAEGPTEVPDTYDEEGPGLLPLAGRWGHPTSIGFYDPALLGGDVLFVLYPCDFDPLCPDPDLGGRRPILLPPPPDPLTPDPRTAACPGGA
jgi:hypothetical protein